MIIITVILICYFAIKLYFKHTSEKQCLKVRINGVTYKLKKDVKK